LAAEIYLTAAGEDSRRPAGRRQPPVASPPRPPVAGPGAGRANPAAAAARARAATRRAANSMAVSKLALYAGIGNAAIHGPPRRRWTDRGAGGGRFAAPALV